MTPLARVRLNIDEDSFWISAVVLEVPPYDVLLGRDSHRLKPLLLRALTTKTVKTGDIAQSKVEEQTTETEAEITKHTEHSETQEQTAETIAMTTRSMAHDEAEKDFQDKESDIAVEEETFPFSHNFEPDIDDNLVRNLTRQRQRKEK